MKNFKKALSVTLALLLLLGAFPLSVALAEGKTVTLALNFVKFVTDADGDITGEETLTKDVKSGDTFGVQVRFYGNDTSSAAASICSAEIYIQYDKDKATGDPENSYSLLSAEPTINLDYAGKGVASIGWSSPNGLKNSGSNKLLKDGVFATLAFTANADITLDELEALFRIVDGVQKDNGATRETFLSDGVTTGDYTLFDLAGVYYVLDADAAPDHRYTVTFDLNEANHAGMEYAGDVAYPRAITYESGDKFKAPDDLEIHGWKLLGWYVSAADDADEWLFDRPGAGNMTLYAKWERNLFTLTLDPVDGAVVNEDDELAPDSEGKVYSGEKVYHEPYEITQTADIESVRHAQEFDCWIDADGNEYRPGDVWDVSDDLTLTARYKDKPTYAVTFNADGNAVATNDTDKHQPTAENMPTTQTVIRDDTAARPETDPADHGYSFVDWYDAAEGGNVWDFDTPITDEVGDVDLYARWTVNDYTLTFDPGDGTMTDDAAVTKEYLGSYDITETAVNNNHFLDFDGWFTAATGGEKVTEWDATGDLTLYAQYKNKPTVDITFDSNGQTIDGYPYSVTLVKDEDTLLEPVNHKPVNPTTEGCTFGGWYKETTSDTEWNFDDVVTGDLRLYAKWTVDQHTLTFVPGDGTMTGDAAVTRNYGSDYKLTETVTPDDYTMDFTGWFDAAEGGSQVATWDAKADKTVYAQYRKKPDLTMTFNSDGTTYQTATVAYGGKAEKPADPSKAGHTFDSWRLDTGDAYDFDAAVTENLTLYAKWNVNQYTLTLVPGDGNSMQDNAATTVTRDYNVSYPVSEKGLHSNHLMKFLAWFDEDGNQVSTWDAKSDLTLYARYTEKETVTVTFELNGKTADGFSTTQTVVKGETVTRPADPVPDGYTFLDWYQNASYTLKWDFDKQVNADTTIYAKWDRQSRALTFDVGEGVLTSGEATVTQLYDDPYEITQTASIEDVDHSREFVGWYDAETGGNQMETWDAKTDVTLYARYVDKTRYTVTFDANGHADAENMPDAQSVIINDPVEEPGTVPTVYGYTFAGWYQDPDGASAWDFGTPITQDTTLYANWTVNQYTLTFEPGDGNSMLDGAAATVTRDYLDAYNGFAEEALNGDYFLYFTGWYDSAEGGNAVTSWDAAADTTVYAHYADKDSIIVTFDPNAQSADGYPLEQRVVKGEAAKVPDPAPAAEGYTFVGWYENAAQEPWDFSTTLNSALRLYARWQVSNVKLTFVPGEGTVKGTNPVTRNYANEYDITQTAAPNDDAQDFAGWFTASDGGEQVTHWDASSDLTLYAHYQKKAALKVTFKSDGRTYSTASVEYGEKAVKPKDPTKTGYVFDTWTLDGDPYDFDTAVKENLTLTAAWTINQYTLTFVPGEGNDMSQDLSYSVTRNYGNTYTISETAVSGDRLMGFVGWYDARTGGNRVISWDATENLTLYAQYSEKETVIVTFDANGLTVDGYPLEQKLLKGDPVTTPTPNPDGYTFVGWYRDAACKNAWDSNMAANTNLTLYAKWDRQSRTLTFDAGEGVLTGEATVTRLYDDPYEITQTASIEEADHSREFVGWYDDETGGNRMETWDAKTDVALYARYVDKARYTVTFDANGHDDATNIPGEQSVIIQDPVVEPQETPLTTHYTFDNWSRDADGGSAWDFDAPVTEDLTLYAQWTPKQYRLTFVPGNWNSMADGAASYVVRDYQDSYAITETAENGDYLLAFAGWYDSPEGGERVDVWDPASDKIVYAQYVDKDIVVMTYDSNGHEIDGYPMEVRTVKGEPTTPPSPDPSTEGYVFSGWYRDTTGKRAWDFDSAVTASTLLYAKWTVNQYTLTLVPGDGNSMAKNAPAVITRDYKNSYPISEEAENADYLLAFDGWYDKATGGAQVTSWDASDDLTLYAHYTKKATAAVTFDANGQDIDGYPLTRTVVKGETVEEPAVPAVERYTFMGWYQDADGKLVWNFNTFVSDDLRLYAKWQKDYTLGDVNGDGQITAIDALLAMQIGAKTYKNAESWQELAADVDGNGIVNAQDALNIMQKAANPALLFPLEKNA